MNIVKIDKDLAEIQWEDASDYEISAGIEIEKPVPVFKKFKLKDMLEDFKALRESKGIPFEIPESVVGVLGVDSDKNKQKKKGKKDKGDLISYKFFQKFKFRTARISSIEKVPENIQKDKKTTTYLLLLSTGRGKPKKEYLLSSYKSLNDLQKLIGKDVVYLANIHKLPKDAKNYKDQNQLILHAKDKSDSIALIIVDKKVRLGSIIR
jgi:tRNA-binding EMAP/Myf-like protein